MALSIATCSAMAGVQCTVIVVAVLDTTHIFGGIIVIFDTHSLSGHLCGRFISQ